MDTPSRHRDEIERFAGQAGILHTLIRDLGPGELDSTPVPGTWSLRTLVIHVMDSDQFAIGRMKRIIAEPNPLLIAYDETAFAAALGYARLDLERCCDLFRLGRLHMAEILRLLPPEAFAREGIHNERGRVSLGWLVSGYVGHVDHHMGFARKKLAALGRPITV